jgi:hypothetical protein
MKMKQLMMAGGIAAALFLSLGIAAAQDNGPGGGFGGGPGGGGGGFGGGPGNFDPSQFQQRMLDNVREQLGFTNDTEWSAVEPLVQKAMTARREAQSGNMGRLFGRGGRGGGPGGQGGNRRGGGMFGTPNPDAEALQKALDDNAPAGQVKELLAKYRTGQKAKEAKAKEAGEALRQVLTAKQEAQATLLGLLD